MSEQELKPPTSSNPDEWHLYISQYCCDRPNGINGMQKVALAISDMLSTRSAGQPAEAVEVCPSCDGSGLQLNNIGEPDECRECRGNTVIPSAQPPASNASAMREALVRALPILQEYARRNPKWKYQTISSERDPLRVHALIYQITSALAAAPDAGWQAIDERLIISGTKLRKSRTQSSWDLEIETSLTAEQNVACTIIQDNFYQAFSGRGKTISEAVIKCLNDADAWLSSPEGQPLAALTQQEPTP